MPPHRSYLNAVTRDPDTMNDMAAPGPPGPLMTDEHDGAVNDVSVALTSNNSTAHILDQINPSINPYSLSNDALVKDLGRRVDVEKHGNVNNATTITSSASRRLHNLQLNKHSAHFSDNSDPNIMVDNDDALAEDLAKLINSSEYDKAADTFSTTSPAYPVCNTDQPNMHYKQMINNPIKQEGDDQLKNVISGIANTFKSCASIAYSADILKFKTVLDEATSSAKPFTPDHSLPDIRNLKHQITKIQGIHIPAHELAASA